MSWKATGAGMLMGVVLGAGATALWFNSWARRGDVGPAAAAAGQGSEAAPSGPVDSAVQDPRLAPPRGQKPSQESAPPNPERSAAAAQTPRGAAAFRSAEELARENEALRARVRDLESAAGSSAAAARAHQVYPLDAELLREAAKRCELRWDMPPIGGAQPETVSAGVVEKLQLTDAEKDQLNAAYAQFSRDLLAKTREVYSAVTGDPNTSGLSFHAMNSEIEKSTPRQELQRIYQAISAERAGLASPTPAQSQSPTERLIRMLIASGDQFEQAAASAVGPARAAELRGLHGGFNWKSVSSYGCPQGS